MLIRQIGNSGKARVIWHLAMLILFNVGFLFQILLLVFWLSRNGRKWKIPGLEDTDPDARLAVVPSSGGSGGGPQGAADCAGEPYGGLLRGAEDCPHS